MTKPSRAPHKPTELLTYLWTLLLDHTVGLKKEALFTALSLWSLEPSTVPDTCQVVNTFSNE